MKKFTKKLLSVIAAGVLSLGALSGCSLITTNVDRDMEQVVAVVSIDETFNEEIKKRQMVSEYNSYGYSYEQYYGYTTSETYDLILTDLVENRIISQQARKALTGTTSVNLKKGYFDMANEVEGDKTSIDEVLSGVNYNGDKFADLVARDAKLSKAKDLARFLTKFEYEYSRYNVLSTLNTLLNNYNDSTQTTVDPYETYSITARASLTQKSTESANEWEMKNDVDKKVIDENTKKSIEKSSKDNKLKNPNDQDKDFNVADYDNKYDLLLNFYKAFNSKIESKLKDEKETKSNLVKVIRDLNKVGLVSDSEAKTIPTTLDDVFKLNYFNDILVASYEEQIITKYKLALQNELEKDITTTSLYVEYQNLYNTQKASYDSSNSSYETALSESNKDTFVVYHPGQTAGNYNGYGYVMNLLLGFNTTQKALLDEYSAKPNIKTAQIESYRKQLLNDLTAKDLRASWIYNGYGEYDEVNNKFTFKDTYVKTPFLNTFDGAINGVTSYDYFDNYGNAAKGYNYKSIIANEISFNDFYTNVLENVDVVGFKPLNEVVNDNKLDNIDSYKFANLNATKTEELDESIIEKFRDVIYAYSTDGGSLSENYGYVYSPVTSATQYVPEFADVAQKLVQEGAGAYAVVATEFGYHILLCSKAIKASTDIIPLNDFKTQINVEGTLPYEFKQYKINLVVANEVSNKATSFINTNKSKVTYYKDRYSDLITETEE